MTLLSENPSEEQCNPLMRETDGVEASERDDNTDLVSTEPVIVVKKIILHELDQGTAYQCERVGQAV